MAAPAHQPIAPEVIARLLEEHIWCANPDLDEHHKLMSKTSTNCKWLHDEIFPTLVPALHRMLELAEAHMQEQHLKEVPKPVAGEGKKVNPNYGPTGRAHPVTWLAEYLMRNSKKHGSTFLESHPYVLVEAGKLQEGKM